MNLLQAERVGVRFGGLVALDDVSIGVREGTVTGLIGPNGAGKTTLFNVLSGVQGANDGRVLFRDEDISTVAPHERARLGIRRSWQNLGLMQDQSVEVNVMAAQHLQASYGPLDPIVRPHRWRRSERDVKARTSEALHDFELEQHRHDLVSDLSFGVARFVELAGILATEPALLLLDEPTTGLDMAERERLARALERVRERGRTLLLVAHDVGFVMDLCETVHVLASGRVICSGPPAEVQRNEAVIEAYLGTQKS